MSAGRKSDPSAKLKIVWGALIASIAISMPIAGGLEAVQTATIVFALPFSIVILLMAVSLWRAIREDWREEQRKEREMRRKLRELTSDNVCSSRSMIA